MHAPVSMTTILLKVLHLYLGEEKISGKSDTCITSWTIYATRRH